MDKSSGHPLFVHYVRVQRYIRKPLQSLKEFMRDVRKAVPISAVVPLLFLFFFGCAGDKSEGVAKIVSASHIVNKFGLINFAVPEDKIHLFRRPGGEAWETFSLGYVAFESGAHETQLLFGSRVSKKLRKSSSSELLSPRNWALAV